MYTGILYYNMCFMYVILNVFSFKYARNSLSKCRVLSNKLLISDEKISINNERGCVAARHWLKRWVAPHPLPKIKSEHFYTTKLIENKKLTEYTYRRCTATWHWFKRCVALYPTCLLFTMSRMYIAIILGVTQLLRYPLLRPLHGSVLHWLKRRTPKCRKNFNLIAASLKLNCDMLPVICQSQSTSVGSPVFPLIMIKVLLYKSSNNNNE